MYVYLFRTHEYRHQVLHTSAHFHVVVIACYTDHCGKEGMAALIHLAKFAQRVLCAPHEFSSPCPRNLCLVLQHEFSATDHSQHLLADGLRTVGQR